MFQLRDKHLAEQILKNIEDLAVNIKIMHVCGTHQDTIVRFGLDTLLKKYGVEVIQGPGCPVCVTTQKEVQKAITLAKEGITIATFGDMIRVPAAGYSLEKARSDGYDVQIVYSIDDAVKLSLKKDTVFFAAGFETTAPSTAVIVKRKRSNMKFLVSHRYIPPALDALLDMGEVNLDGILCPGHVSTIIGMKPYQPLADKYSLPFVIAGFEPIDVLMAVYMIAKQKHNNQHVVENEYRRCVSDEGNKKALSILDEIFEPVDAKWRGFPVIPQSKMKLKDSYSEYDAEIAYETCLEDIHEVPEPKNCLCGDVLRGITYPQKCPLFGASCTPDTPIGPCMVSIEGSCNIEYRYKND